MINFDKEKVLSNFKKHTPETLSGEALIGNLARIFNKEKFTPNDQREIGSLVTEIISLRKEVDELKQIREQYECKYKVRMFADGKFEEIEE